MGTLARLSMAAVLSFACTSVSRAATYYVDFDGGKDDNTGVAAERAFKHSPGDKAATGNAKNVTLAAGDSVMFKGGVAYRGSVDIHSSGAAGKPIVLDGNSGGKFGTGAAIIEGSEPLSGWKACKSADEVGGNPNWKKLYVASVPKGCQAFTVNLCAGADLLKLAQDPNSQDAFFQDEVRNFLPTTTPLPHHVGAAPGAKQKGGADMEYVEADYFKQTDPHYWDGAYFAIMAKPNWLHYQKVTGFVPAEHKIRFEGLTEELFNPATHPDVARFCMFNAIGILDEPGEYWFNEKPEADGSHKVYLWPTNAGKSGPEGITCSVRKTGFTVEGANFVTIRGFKIEKQAGDGASAIDATKCSNLVIKDNEVTLLCAGVKRTGAIAVRDIEEGLIDHNRIALNRRMAGIMASRFNNSVTSNNTLHKNGSTAVDYYTCQHSKLLKNVVTEHSGVHANGLTMYVGCSDILVEGNKVTDSNVALTLQDGTDIVVRYNVFDGHGKSPSIGLWAGKPLEHITIVNNLCLHAAPNHEWSAAIFSGNKEGSGYVIKNNIIDGLAGDGFPSDTVFSNNIYTQLGPWQKSKKKEMGAGEILVTDLAKIFVDVGKMDFHLKAGSPGIDAGVDVGAKVDFEGKTVPTGKAPDIGAFEKMH